MKEKRCGRCNKVKSVLEFYKSTRSKSGYTKLCIKCSDLNFSEQEIEYKTIELLCNPEEKVCRRCHKIKHLSKFRGRKSASKGKGSTCKSCEAQYSKNNRDKIYSRRRSDKRKQFLKTIRSLKEQEVYCTKCNSIKTKEYFNEKLLRNNKKTGTCKNCHNSYRRKYRKIKKKDDSLFSFTEAIRKLIYNIFYYKNIVKNSRTHKIFGTTFKNALSELNNNPYGFSYGDENIDIDHIIPLSSAETEEDIYKLNHFSNFQLLPSYYNRHIKKDNPFNREHFENWLEETNYFDK